MQTSALIAAVMAQPCVAGVAWYVGAEYRHQEDAPNRIVFVPKGGRYMPVEKHARPASAQFVRNIATRRSEYDAYIWAAGTSDDSVGNCDAAELLLNNFLGALWLTLGDAAPVEDKALKVGGDQISDTGVVYVLSFHIDVPVTLPTTSTQSIQLVGTGAVAGTSAQLPTVTASTS